MKRPRNFRALILDEFKAGESYINVHCVRGRIYLHIEDVSSVEPHYMSPGSEYFKARSFPSYVSKKDTHWNESQRKFESYEWKTPSLPRRSLQDAGILPNSYNEHAVFRFSWRNWKYLRMLQKTNNLTVYRRLLKERELYRETVAEVRKLNEDAKAYLAANTFLQTLADEALLGAVLATEAAEAGIDFMEELENL